MSLESLTGTEIGEFVVHEVIGYGGMATVYRASQPMMRRDVALKVIRIDELSEKHRDFAARFASEAELIASLEHPHILPVFSYGFSKNYAFLAMRLLRGGSLEDRLHGDSLSTGHALELFNQIAQGLAHAHSKGIIHRDIKPSNILLDDGGHAYLTDFGLAKLVSAEAGYTKSGQIMGTPVYMSPEQLRGEPLDFRSDVYALGCILYEMLTGSPPFVPVDGDVIPVIFKHLQTPPEPPSRLNPHLTTAFDAAALRALAKSPDDRFPSVREMATAVQQALGQAPAANLPRPAETILNQTRQVPVAALETQPHQMVVNRRGFLAGVLVVAIVVVLAFLLIFQMESGRVAAEATNAAVQLGLVQAETEAAVRQAQDATATANAVLPVFDPSNVVLGEVGRLEAMKPDEVETSLALRVLGQNGFIAIVPCNTSSEYFAALTREIAQFARERGIQTRVYDPDSDGYRQLTLLERAITENARGVVLCPVDLELIRAPLTEMRRIGIPVVSQASGMGEYGAVQVLTDHTLLGKKPGEYAGQIAQAEIDGPIKAVVLTFDDLPDIKERADGMIEGLLEYAPDAELVARVIGGTPDWARDSITELLADGVEFNVILSINDAGSFGALEALEQAGVPYEDVMIFSVDAEILAQRYIREGKYFRASVETGRTVYAGAAVDLIIKLLAGATLPEIIVIEPGELVTRESLGVEP